MPRKSNKNKIWFIRVNKSLFRSLQLRYKHVTEGLSLSHEVNLLLVTHYLLLKIIVLKLKPLQFLKENFRKMANKNLFKEKLH